MSTFPLRLAFMGTPDFALASLKAIAESTEHEIVCVYSQPPRPKGRGQVVQPSPVQEYAEANGIPVYTPKSLKSSESQAEFASHNLDVAVVAAYGLILPKAILEAPRFGCLNIHASLLPRWRGASPIQRAIWAGDRETGITIMQMDEGLDTGPEISKHSLPITSQTTSASLHDDLAALGGRMIVQVLAQISGARAKLPASPQNDEDYTYAPLLKKEDGQVDWGKSAAEIDRQIRALNPWPGVWTSMGGKRLKILSAGLPLERAGDVIEAGTILNKQGDIVCGDGFFLRLSRVQPEGKAVMDFPAALNGHYIKIGERLS